MAAAIRARVRAGDYDAITNGADFAAALTRDLQGVHADGHLAVHFSADPLSERAHPASQNPESIERQRRMAQSVNFGFERVDRLPGNVGYIELNGFADPQDAAQTAIAAMNLVGHTDALIIDLRYNGGGVPGIGQLISSYLFSGRSVHLHTIHWRENDRVEQFWTFPHVPGPRYVGKPVYILTSRSTASAPESFAYSLQALERATIVGEQTAGAANPGRSFLINQHFSAFIPVGRAANPITGSNWEGAGITPDITAPASTALQVAHVAALRQLREAATSPQQRRQLDEAIREVEAQ
jgi:C-terminal processing protease CtpA/Prc